MTKPIKAAFEFEGVVLKLDKLLPMKQLGETLRRSGKYEAIVASIREVGIIEPLIVHPQPGGKYLLLDGHARVQALRDLEIEETFCLISTDDEAYTYDNKINRVAPIQANRMILKALEAGVPDERIAKALNLSLSTVRRNRTLLTNICAEAVELLKDKPVAVLALGEFKKVKPMRQIEMAELMVAAATYTAAYVKALVIATPKPQLVEPEKPKKAAGLRPEDLAKIEHEMQVLEKDFLLLDETYGRNVVELTVARGYLKKLLDTGKVVRFLASKHKDLLTEFQKIIESESLDS